MRIFQSSTWLDSPVSTGIVRRLAGSGRHCPAPHAFRGQPGKAFNTEQKGGLTEDHGAVRNLGASRGVESNTARGAIMSSPWSSVSPPFCSVLKYLLTWLDPSAQAASAGCGNQPAQRCVHAVGPNPGMTRRGVRLSIRFNVGRRLTAIFRERVPSWCISPCDSSRAASG